MKSLSAAETQKQQAVQREARARPLLGSIPKLLISVGLLLFIVHRVGWSSILEHGRGVRPVLIVIPFALVVASALVRSLNWTMLLRETGTLISYPHALYSYWVGTFAGAALPTGLGIDLARVIALNRQHKVSIETAASTGLALNFVGLMALSLLVTSGAMTLWYRGESAAFVLVILAAGLGSLALSSSVLLKPTRLPGLRSKIYALMSSNRSPLERIGHIVSGVQMFDGRWKLLLFSLGMAIATQLLGILTAYTVALAFGIRVPLLLFLAFLPVVAVTRYLPISFGGFGGEQGVFVLLFERGGVSAAEAFVVSFGFSAVTLLFVLSCGIGYIVRTLTSMVGEMRPSQDPSASQHFE